MCESPIKISRYWHVLQYKLMLRILHNGESVWYAYYIKKKCNLFEAIQIISKHIQVVYFTHMAFLCNENWMKILMVSVKHVADIEPHIHETGDE